MIEVTAREKDGKMVLSFTVESQAPNAASIKGGPVPVRIVLWN